MVQMQTYLKVADNTGAKELMCFRVLGGTRKRYANICLLYTSPGRTGGPCDREVHHQRKTGGLPG